MLSTMNFRNAKASIYLECRIGPDLLMTKKISTRKRFLQKGTKKTKGQPVHGVTLHRLSFNMIIAYNSQAPVPKAGEMIQMMPESP